MGDESRSLGFSQRQELEFDKGQAQYDGFPLKDYSISDINGVLLEQYHATVGSYNNRGATSARSLLTRKGQLTNAALLLFGEHPQQEFPEAYVRVLRFMSVKRGIGRV